MPLTLLLCADFGVVFVDLIADAGTVLARLSALYSAFGEVCLPRPGFAKPLYDDELDGNWPGDGVDGDLPFSTLRSVLPSPSQSNELVPPSVSIRCTSSSELELGGAIRPSCWHRVRRRVGQGMSQFYEVCKVEIS